MKRTLYFPVLPFLLLSLAAAMFLLFMRGQTASVQAQVGDAEGFSSPTPEDAPAATLAPGQTTPSTGYIAAGAPGKQVVIHLLILELDPVRLRDNEFDLAKELAIEPAPQTDPATKAPLVARLQPREWRLLSRSLTLAGIGKVLSRPALVTLDGRPAKIHVGGEIPLVAIEETVNGKREDRVESVAFGTTVELTPRFTAARTLRLEWNAITSHLSRDKETLPRLQARTLRGAASFDLGESLVIADVPAIAAEGHTEAGLLVAMTAEEIVPGTLPGAPLEDAEAPTFFPGVGRPWRKEDADPTTDPAPALPPGHEPAALPADFRLIELPLEGEGGERAVRGISPGDRIRLFGRERLDDGALGEEVHDVVENVVVHRVFVVDGRATLLLQLAPRDADKLKLAREHCQIRIEVEAKSDEHLDPLGHTIGPETRSSTAPAATATDPTAAPAPGLPAPSSPPASLDPATLPSAPAANRPPAPLREELQSLRDEVRGLRHDIDRVIELLERRESSGERGAGQQLPLEPTPAEGGNR